MKASVKAVTSEGSPQTNLDLKLSLNALRSKVLGLKLSRSSSTPTRHCRGHR